MNGFRIISVIGEREWEDCFIGGEIPLFLAKKSENEVQSLEGFFLLP